MDKKYNPQGYLIVSELGTCPLWQKDDVPGYLVCEHDCFYCVFSDFRQEDYIRSLEGKDKTEMLYSICRNEKNRNKELFSK